MDVKEKNGELVTREGLMGGDKGRVDGWVLWELETREGLMGGCSGSW